MKIEREAKLTITLETADDIDDFRVILNAAKEHMYRFPNIYGTYLAVADRLINA